MSAANKLPRKMLCASCGQIRLRKGCKTGPAGLVCAECVPELPPAPKKAQRSPEGRPKAESKEAWRPWSADRALSEPAQAAVAPSVVRTLPPYDPRYGVDPSSVTPLFSALGIGRYLPEGEAA